MVRFKRWRLSPQDEEKVIKKIRTRRKNYEI